MGWSKEDLDSLLSSLKGAYGPKELSSMLGLDKLLSERSCLSDSAIQRYLESGRIVIEPFKRQNLATSSYDVTLGSYFYKEQKIRTKTILNPYDEKVVKSIWQLNEAQTMRSVMSDEMKIDSNSLSEYAQIVGENISPEDRVILIEPGETILAHTEEYIGGRDNITTMMKARSSWGRNFIEVCKCAGWGDVGYVNRWTMEITNNSQHYAIPLPVGFRIAQIVFFEVEPIVAKDYASAGGKYQSAKSVDELRREWTPDAMLPKMWKDREIKDKYKR